jgi:hypothetical protein
VPPASDTYREEISEELGTALQPLLELKSPVHVTIHVCHKGRRYSSWLSPRRVQQGVEYLSYMRPSLRALVEAGHKVKIDILEESKFDIEGEEQLTPDYWAEKVRLVYKAEGGR